MLIGIVADDLTGAADSVAPFASRGLHADVAFTRREKLAVEMPESDARAWTTETRERPLEQKTAITRLVRAATRRLKVFSPRLYYKKIDSTLRGHLRRELDAVRVELPGRIALICPAFPENGRTVQDGILRVHGNSLQSVRSAFAIQDDPTAVEVNLTTLRDEDMAAFWDRLSRQGVHTVFCDAVTSHDLDALAAAVIQQPDRFLPVGSAGFSAALARQMLPESSMQSLPDAIRNQFANERVLVVVGSLNPVSRRQARGLAEKAKIDPIVIGGADDYVDFSELAQQRFALGERVVLLLTAEEITPRRAGWIEAGMHYVGTMRVSNPGLCMILTGGDTAAAVLSGAGSGMKVVGELAPGVVVSELYGIKSLANKVHGMPAIVKAGGFGSDETLARCVGL